MPLTLTGAGVPVGFTPTQLAGYVDSPYSIAALRGLGKLWQDVGKTVTAVADGDPVRVVSCGATDYTAPSDAARPLLWSEGEDKWSLSFDGVDDHLAGPVGSGDVFAGNTPLTLAASVVVNRNNGTFQVIFNTNGSDGYPNECPNLQHNSAAVFSGEFGSNSGKISGPTVSAYPSSARMIYRYTGSQVLMRYDGTDRTPVSYSAAAVLTGRLYIGRLSVVYPIYFGGRVRGLTLVAVSISDTRTTALDTYLAALAP